MERIEIPLNRIKVSLCFLVHFFLSVLCIGVTYSLITGCRGAANFPFICLGSLMAAIFGWFCLNYLVILFRFSSGLIISDSGITNNTGLIQWGVIEWNDIENVVSWKERWGVNISLETYEHDKYADKVGGIMKLLILTNDDGFFMLNSPLIRVWLLKGYSTETLKLVKDSWVKYSKNA